MHRQEWKEVDSVSRSMGWRAGVWIIGIVVFFGVLSAGIWYVKVKTSDIKGAGDQERITNDAKNRIGAQETFEELFQKIKGYDRNLDQAAKDKAANPGDQFHATNYSGLVKICNDAIFQYNANARKVTQAKWLSPDLPYEIDTKNPETDCKETVK